MKTPYDAALRARRREVDDMRIAVRAASDRAFYAREGARAANEAMIRERAFAAEHGMLAIGGYFARAGARREHLAASRAAADAALDTARDQARESYGLLRLMEGAADGFRADAIRAAAGIEQARVDDIAGEGFARAPSRSRSGPRRT